MNSRPVYTKTFSRDFTLAIIEMWYRSEALNPKQWADKKQPFQPFIVFERAEGTVNSYYDPQGINWVKKLLIRKAQEEKDFLADLEKNIAQQVACLRPIYEQGKALSHDELVAFLEKLELCWSWFEAAWWLWESTPEERKDFDLSESFKKQREDTQNEAPQSDMVIRKSLEKLYPKLKELVEVLRTKEICENKIPSKGVLQKRYAGYFFTNDKLYVGATKENIEQEYGITFEKLAVDASVNEIKGTPAQQGVIQGRVKIVHGPLQNNKVNAGDILVATMTLPTFMPAMKKAGAIVTDEGGIMCHAALIARELKKPCITGTKIATKALKDGELVEVDADEGVVRRI